MTWKSKAQQPQVERAAQILGEYNQRILDGRVPNTQEVKSLLRIATGDTNAATPRSILAHPHSRAG